MKWQMSIIQLILFLIFYLKKAKAYSQPVQIFLDICKSFFIVTFIKIINYLKLFIPIPRQQGGVPTPFDRNLGLKFAAKSLNYMISTLNETKCNFKILIVIYDFESK